MIWGDGSYTGRKVLTVVFSGCNRWDGLPENRVSSVCSFCDADFFRGKRMQAKDILDDLLKRNGNITPKLPVILTGGEPGLQVDEKLVVHLRSFFYDLCIETNGSVRLKGGKHYKRVILSPKQSREETQQRWCNDLELLYPFINKDITLEKFLDFPCRRIFLRPIEEGGVYSKLSKLNRNLTRDFILNTNIPNKEIRCSFQIGKAMDE